MHNHSYLLRISSLVSQHLLAFLFAIKDGQVDRLIWEVQCLVNVANIVLGWKTVLECLDVELNKFLVQRAGAPVAKNKPTVPPRDRVYQVFADRVVDKLREKGIDPIKDRCANYSRMFQYFVMFILTVLSTKEHIQVRTFERKRMRTKEVGKSNATRTTLVHFSG